MPKFANQWDNYRVTCKKAVKVISNKHFRHRSNLSRFTNLYSNSEIPTEIKLNYSPTSSDDEVDEPPKTIKINADVHHQPPPWMTKVFKKLYRRRNQNQNRNN